MTVFAGTSRQESFLRSLLAERGPGGQPVAALLDEAGTGVDGFLAAIGSVREASQVIDQLLAYPRAEAPPAPAPSGNGQQTFTEARTSGNVNDVPARTPGGTPERDGVFLLDGTVYRVQKSRESGRLYAKRLVPPATAGGKPTWQYIGQQDPFHRLAGHEMTAQQAVDFGVQYGVCARCGRILTDPTSVSRSIGPVCWRYFQGVGA